MGLSLYLPWWTLPLALVAACFVAGRQSDCRLKGTAVTLLVDWCLCTAVVSITKNSYPVVWFAIVDYFAALVVLLLISLGRTRSRWQTRIGLLYGCEFIVHAAVAWAQYKHPGPQAAAAEYYGWHTIYIFAWAQVVVIATWGGSALRHRHHLSRRSVAHHQPVSARIRQHR